MSDNYTTPLDTWHDYGHAIAITGEGSLPHATVNTSSTTFDVAYGSAITRPSAARALDPAYLYLKLRFLVADTDDDEVACTVWLWDKFGDPLDALIVNPVRAGSHPETVHPENANISLTNYFYADTLTVTTANIAYTYYNNTANGIAEICFANKGWSWMYGDFDINLPSGTDGTTGVLLAKGYN